MLLPIISVSAVCVLAGIMYQNAFTRSKNNIQESWSQIEVQLIRRSDLIPNLVNVAKGYAKHEKETLTSVVEARNAMVAMSKDGSSKSDIMKQNDILSSSLKSVFALNEEYPELKSNEHFSRLIEELTSTENKISYSRKLYNSTIASYNTKIQSLPGSLFAKIFKFKSENSLISASMEQREAVKVEF